MKPSNFTRFSISKPWGYYPPEVEEVIEKYEETIGQLNAKLTEKIRQNAKLKDRIVKLEDELRAMHIEMSSLELPDTEEIVESVVLNDFRNYPSGVSQRYMNEDLGGVESKDNDLILNPAGGNEEIKFQHSENDEDDEDDLFKIVT